MPLQQWDTGALQGPWDADPLSSQPPWIDELPGLQHSWDTVQPQGSQDAGPSSLQHSGVEEMPRPLALESSTFSKMPWHHSEIRFEALLLDSKNNYKQKYGKLPDFLVCPKTVNSDIITPTPLYAPSIPSDNEGPGLPRRNMPNQHKWFNSELTDLPQSSASESYVFVPMPSSEEDNPLFRPDPMLYKVWKLTKTLRRPRGQGQKLAEALHILFDKDKKLQAFPSFVTETRDKEGIKWYKFQPDYADHLMLIIATSEQNP